MGRKAAFSRILDCIEDLNKALQWERDLIIEGQDEREALPWLKTSVAECREAVVEYRALLPEGSEYSVTVGDFKF